MNNNELKDKLTKILAYYESDGSNITYDETMERLLALFTEMVEGELEQFAEWYNEQFERAGAPYLRISPRGLEEYLSQERQGK